jgi:uncharacterized protein (UPF0333 family)
MKKRGQIGVEYMIIIGFVTFAITVILIFAYFYSDQVKDKIRMNQIENFGLQVVNSAESVFYSGEPSKSTVRYYLPDGVTGINITENYLVIEVSTSTGVNRIAYESRVPLNGTIEPGEGIRVLVLEATEDYLQIS